MIRTLGAGAEIILGAGVGMSSTSIVAGKSIQIGEGTLLGAGCLLLDNDFHAPGPGFSWKTDHQSTAKPIRIGRGCFVGTRSIILKGVTLGDRTVVGAGSVVTQSFPDGSTIGGNPAKNLRGG